MKKTLFIFSTLIANVLLSQQATYTMTSEIPISMTSLGTGTYDTTVFYHNLEYGLVVDLAKKTDNITGIPIDFRIAARGGLNPFFTLKGNTGNVGVGTDNPLARLEVSKDNVNNQNLMLAKFTTSGNTGGSNRITIGYHYNANLEMNSAYSTTGVRYGSYGDFNIENDNLGDTVNGAINFISANKIHMSIRPNGNAYLQGKFEAKEIKVTQTPTADFVFAEDYKLPKLEDVEKHIKEKKHLPEIVSAKVMEKEGVNVGEFQIKLLQKIEELTLYSIDQNKEIKSQAEKLKELTLHSIDQNEQIKYQAEKLKELEKQLQEIVSSKK